MSTEIIAAWWAHVARERTLLFIFCCRVPGQSDDLEERGVDAT